MKEDHPILRKILIRILLFIAVMFILSVVVFVLARLAPGDPLQSFYGDALENMTDAEKDAARVRLGLDAGMVTQYVRWITGAFHGDFGLSFKYKMPVMQVIRPLIGNTLTLGLLAYILVFALAVILALICALHEDSLPGRSAGADLQCQSWPAAKQRCL